MDSYVLRSTAGLFLIGTLGMLRITNHSNRNLLLTGDWQSARRTSTASSSTACRARIPQADQMVPLIKNLFDGPYLERFAHTQRPGWTTWGTILPTRRHSARGSGYRHPDLVVNARRWMGSPKTGQGAWRLTLPARSRRRAASLAGKMWVCGGISKRRVFSH